MYQSEYPEWGRREAMLKLIDDLPDPSSYLLDRLDDITLAIRDLQGVSDEEKANAEKALEEIRGFARKFGPAAAVQMLTTLFKGG